LGWGGGLENENGSISILASAHDSQEKRGGEKEANKRINYRKKHFDY